MTAWTLEKRQAAAERCRRHRPWTRSTGPRTLEGKQASSLNATKHGYYGHDRKIVRAFLREQRHFMTAVQCYFHQSNRQTSLKTVERTEFRKQKNGHSISQLFSCLTFPFSAKTPLNQGDKNMSEPNQTRRGFLRLLTGTVAQAALPLPITTIFAQATPQAPVLASGSALVAQALHPDFVEEFTNKVLDCFDLDKIQGIGCNCIFTNDIHRESVWDEKQQNALSHVSVEQLPEVIASLQHAKDTLNSENWDGFSGQVINWYGQRLAFLHYISSIPESTRGQLVDHKEFKEWMSSCDKFKKIGDNYGAALSDKALEIHLHNMIEDFFTVLGHLSDMRNDIGAPQFTPASYFMHLYFNQDEWGSELQAVLPDDAIDHPEIHLPTVIKSFIESASLDYFGYRFGMYPIPEAFASAMHQQEESGERDPLPFEIEVDIGNYGSVENLEAMLDNRTINPALNAVLDETLLPYQTALVPNHEQDTPISFVRHLRFAAAGKAAIDGALSAFKADHPLVTVVEQASPDGTSPVLEISYTGDDVDGTLAQLQEILAQKTWQKTPEIVKETKAEPSQAAQEIPAPK